MSDLEKRRVADREKSGRKSCDYLPCGTYSTYRDHVCRLVPCKRANAEYRADLRRRYR